MGDRSLHCGNRNSCDLDIDPITFIYELNAYSLDIHQMCKYKLPTSRFSKVIVWQTYRQTDKLRVFTSGHVTKMAVTPFDPPYPITPCTRRPDGSILSRTGVMGDWSLHYGNRHMDVYGSCNLDLDSMTFVYEFDP